MLDVKALKAEMVRNGYTQESLAKAIGMTSRTFYNRLKSGDFGCNEIQSIMVLLHIDNPTSIFFAEKVT